MISFSIGRSPLAICLLASSQNTLSEKDRRRQDRCTNQGTEIITGRLPDAVASTSHMIE